MSKKKVVNSDVIVLSEEEKMIKEEMEIMKKYPFLSEPTYKFNVGDKVNCPLSQNAKVVKVLEDGKFYWVEFLYNPIAYGKELGERVERRVYTWLNIRKITEKYDLDLFERNSLGLRFSKTKLRELVNRYYEDGIDVEPEYQREHVWELEDKQKLINSIFTGMDIGKFVISFNSSVLSSEDGFMYEIIDGKQRLTAIIEYYEDKFECNGVKFSDLSIMDKKGFMSTTIDIAETEDLSEKKKREYFLAINDMGKPVDKSHIEKVRKEYLEME